MPSATLEFPKNNDPLVQPDFSRFLDRQAEKALESATDKKARRDGIRERKEAHLRAIFLAEQAAYTVTNPAPHRLASVIEAEPFFQPKIGAGAARAFSKSAQPKPVTRKKGIGPKGPNSELIIQDLQGLDIQPFIFGLTAAIPDMDEQIGDRRTAKQQDTFETVRTLEKTLWDAGYSTKGNPYWVHPHGPSLQHMRTIAEAGENCIDILNDQRAALKQKHHQADSQDRQKTILTQINRFEDRYLKFAEAVEGITALADAEQIRQIERDRVTKLQPGEQCALA